MSKVLVLSPHTDDGELGCGGTIAKLIEQGEHVVFASFSTCDNDALVTECLAASRMFGLKSFDVITPDDLINYPVRNFPAHRQNILDGLIDLGYAYKPDLVFLPNSFDIHQDHQVIHQEGVRAFKHCSILGYELPWNNFQTRLSYFYVLNVEHIVRKVNALAEYKSQQHKPYFEESLVCNQARARGLQVGVDFAEAFEVIRWIVK